MVGASAYEPLRKPTVHRSNREMLQTLISRMAGYGASFKSYCITVTTVVIGFGLTLRSPAVAGFALLSR